MKILARALALMLIAAPAAAADKYPNVRDTSQVDATGARVLQLSVDLNAWPRRSGTPTPTRRRSRAGRGELRAHRPVRHPPETFETSASGKPWALPRAGGTFLGGRQTRPLG